MVGKQSDSLDWDGSEALNDVLQAGALVPQEQTTGEAKPAGLPRSRPWKLLALGLGVVSVLGAVSGTALWLLTTPPPSPNCQQLSPMATDMERLLCAQEAANSGDLPKILAGMDLLKQWQPDNPLYGEAQRLIAEWSKPVLRAAREKMEQSDFRGAVELANRIPATSPVYPDAQAEIKEWQRYWQRGEALVTAAGNAMKAQNWYLAAEKIAALKDFEQDYWQFDRAKSLTQLLAKEQRARKITTAAIATAQSGQPSALGLAIAQLVKMDAGTYAWADAQNVLKQWSETLLTLGLQQWQKGEFTTAMATVDPVLKNAALAPSAQDLLWLSQAGQHAAWGRATQKPTFTQIWNLNLAIATAQFIRPESRYYKQAQTSLANWQAQLQDTNALQLAWMVGEIPLAPAKTIAIAQAQQLGGDRPRRQQAQTLIAYWDKARAELGDRPYLTYARTLAQKNEVPALQQAIAQAKLVALGRPLRREAQTLIAAWKQQIEAIEDQPVLDRAWALANQGDLSGAIQAANGIGGDRALYREAQTAVSTWQGQLRAAEEARARATAPAANPAPARPPAANPESADTTSNRRWSEPAPAAQNSAPEGMPTVTETAPPPRSIPAPPEQQTPPTPPPPSYRAPASAPVYSPPTAPIPTNEPPPPPARQPVLEPYAAPVYEPYAPAPPPANP